MLCAQELISLSLMERSSVCAAHGRITRKIMPHKLQAIKEKTKACRSSSTVLLPGDWAMLGVAKPLHYFATRCAQGALIVL